MSLNLFLLIVPGTENRFVCFSLSYTVEFFAALGRALRFSLFLAVRYTTKLT